MIICHLKRAHAVGFLFASFHFFFHCPRPSTPLVKRSCCLVWIDAVFDYWPFCVLLWRYFFFLNAMLIVGIPGNTIIAHFEVIRSRFSSDSLVSPWETRRVIMFLPINIYFNPYQTVLDPLRTNSFLSTENKSKIEIMRRTLGSLEIIVNSQRVIVPR